MPVVNCSKERCHAPDGLCKELITRNYQQCQYFNRERKSDSDVDVKSESEHISWTGLALRPNEIELVSQRSSPFMIGLVGSADAGKTTYLAMLYTLLFNGRSFNNWHFSGSYTLREWELLAKTLQIREGKKIEYPQSTPSAPDFYSIYHLALRRDSSPKDLLLSDSSGEVFSKWATNVDDPAAENARWIYENSDAFLFFIDCEKLVEDKAKAKGKVLRLARQLHDKIDDRPLVILWSKADKISEILPNFKAAIDDRLKELFPKALVLPISNYSKSDSDELCHVNNLKATEHLLDLTSNPNSCSLKISPEDISTQDYFFLYRGRYGTK